MTPQNGVDFGVGLPGGKKIHCGREEQDDAGERTEKFEHPKNRNCCCDRENRFHAGRTTATDEEGGRTATDIFFFASTNHHLVQSQTETRARRRHKILSHLCTRHLQTDSTKSTTIATEHNNIALHCSVEFQLTTITSLAAQDSPKPKNF